MSSEPADQIVNVLFSGEDIVDMAEEEGISSDLALERAREWGSYIEETIARLAAEQLRSAIVWNQP